jgi:hypothetical protein
MDSTRNCSKASRSDAAKLKKVERRRNQAANARHKASSFRRSSIGIDSKRRQNLAPLSERDKKVRGESFQKSLFCPVIRKNKLKKIVPHLLRVFCFSPSADEEKLCTSIQKEKRLGDKKKDD